MPRTTPDVLDGMRAPRSVRLEQIKANAEDNSLPEARVGTDHTVYVSKYRRYRVQVSAPQTFIDPATGRKNSAGKMIAAIFDEGIYRNKERDPKIREQIDEALQSNPYFGKFGSTAHFWLASEQNAVMERSRRQAAMDTLKSMPREAVEQFVAELRQGEAEDHELLPEPVPSRPRHARAGAHRRSSHSVSLGALDDRSNSAGDG